MKNHVLCNGKNEIVHDVRENPVLNNGDWKNLTSKDQFLTTVSKFHSTHNKTGEHFSPYEACYHNYLEKCIEQGRMYDAGEPKAMNDGNPINYEIMKTAVKFYQHPHYRTNSDSALSPI